MESKDNIMRKGELFHLLYPKRAKINWSIFYIAFAIVFVGIVYVAADHIKTHGAVTGNIVLSTPYSKYLLGENISFSLTNRYNTSIFVTNQCPGEPIAVYHQENNTWVRVHDTAPSKDCPSEDRQVIIPANSTVTVSLAPWHNLFKKPGNYRLVSVVDGYDTLPYIDFEVVSAPAALAPVLANGPSAKQSSGQSQSTSQQNSSPGSTNTPSTPPSTPPSKSAPKTVTLSVNSAGNYDNLNITLNVGDSIKFVYSPPINNEVITQFSNVSPTTTSQGSVTLDSEFQTRTKTFSSAGKWTYKATDHNGNTGTLTVK